MWRLCHSNEQKAARADVDYKWDEFGVARKLKIGRMTKTVMTNDKCGVVLWFADVNQEDFDSIILPFCTSMVSDTGTSCVYSEAKASRQMLIDSALRKSSEQLQTKCW